MHMSARRSRIGGKRRQSIQVFIIARCQIRWIIHCESPVILLIICTESNANILTLALHLIFLWWQANYAKFVVFIYNRSTCMSTRQDGFGISDRLLFMNWLWTLALIGNRVKTPLNWPTISAFYISLFAIAHLIKTSFAALRNRFILYILCIMN